MTRSSGPDPSKYADPWITPVDGNEASGDAPPPAAAICSMTATGAYRRRSCSAASGMSV